LQKFHEKSDELERQYRDDEKFAQAKRSYRMENRVRGFIEDMDLFKWAKALISWDDPDE
jgi:hypothetical protein